MTYILDIDGTLCNSTPVDGTVDYRYASPIHPMIDKVNELFALGHHITLFTARNMRTYEGNLDLINKFTRPVLEEWLLDNGVRYTELIMGKPWGPDVVYVDDRQLTMNQFLSVQHNIDSITEAFNKNKEWI